MFENLLAGLTYASESRNGFPVVEIETTLRLKTIFEEEVQNLMEVHPAEENQNAILFYGPSNFAKWTEMEEDMAEMAAEYDYLYFVDAEEMTYDGENFDESLFIEDGLHLTHEARLIWYENYIKPAIEMVIEENGLDIVRK